MSGEIPLTMADPVIWNTLWLAITDSLATQVEGQIDNRMITDLDEQCIALRSEQGLAAMAGPLMQLEDLEDL